MAFGALASLATILDEILNHDKFHTLINNPTQSEIASLRQTISALQSFLEDIPHDKDSSLLEGRITDAANQAQDIIEDLILSHTQHNDFWSSIATALAVVLGNASQQQMFSRAMQEINNGMQKMLHGMKLMKPIPRKNEIGETFDIPKLGANGKEDRVVGYENELLAMKDQLTGRSSKLQIISIVGMAGIGKTTLARNIYNDKLIVENFYIRSWATISQKIDVRHILQSLLSFDQSPQVDNLMERLYKGLKGRKYLVVLDDMWTTEVWDTLRRAFPDDGNGSRIILTTRIVAVACYPNPSLIVRLNILTINQSWDLLKEKVFGRENCPSELKSIGRAILPYCHGLPLAIVVIAGLLSLELTPAHWNRVVEIVHSGAVIDDNVEGILSLSYHNLPPHLKACFLYMGGFPENHAIGVSRLIRLWVAEGFLKTHESKSPEEMAEECLEGLVLRHLVFVVSRRSNGKIKRCGIHDVLRTMCIRKDHEERFSTHVPDESIGYSTTKTPNPWHRLIIQSNDLDGYEQSNTSRIRTAFVFQENERFISLMGCFRLLRVLDMQSIILNVFPFVVLQLLNLRYLALICDLDINFKIPRSISKLLHLQTLILGVGKEIYLPIEIWRMPRLRHLLFFGSFIFVESNGMDVLQNLQTLHEVANISWSEGMLNKIPNVRKLGVIYSVDVPRRQWTWYKLQNLARMRHLEKLCFRILDNTSIRSPLDRDPTPTPSLESLAFPETLRELTLDGCKIHWERMSAMVGTLPNLVVLKLRNDAFQGDVWEMREGEYFPRLKVLLLRAMSLRRWVAKASCFPRLERLGLYGCRELYEIPMDIGEIPTLHLIEVEKCRSCVEELARMIQEEQQEYGNELQVHIVSH